MNSDDDQYEDRYRDPYSDSYEDRYGAQRKPNPSAAHEQQLEEAASGKPGTNFNYRQEGDTATDNRPADKKHFTPGEVNDAEINPAVATSKPDTLESDQLDKGWFTGSGEQKKGKRSLRGALKKHSLAILILGTPSAGAVIGLLLLLVFISSLELPNVMKHTENREFVAVTRQFEKNAVKVSETKMVIDSASEGAASEGATAENPKGGYGAFKDRFKNLKDATWERMNMLRLSSLMKAWGADKYSPKLATETFASEHGLKLTYTTSKLTGREILTQIETDYGTYKVRPVTGLANWTPGVRQFLTTRNQNAAFNAFQNDTSAAIEGSNIAPIIRGSVARNLRKAVGGNLGGWLLNKFVNKDTNASLLEETRQTFNEGEAGPRTADNATSEPIKDGEEAAKKATKEAVADDKQLTQIITQKFDSGAANAITTALKSSEIKTAIGIANPLYGVFTPYCIVYDASVQRSQPVIDNQSAQQQNIFNGLAARADQQKAGTLESDPDGTLAAAIEATGNQIGDVSKSNPEIWAQGGTVDTTDIPSVQAGAGGIYVYSVLNAVGLSGTGASVANAISDKVCPTLTSTPVAAALGAINIAVGVATLGTETAVVNGSLNAAGRGSAEIAELTAKQFAKNVVNNLLRKRIVTTTKNGVEKEIPQTALNRAGKFAFKQGLIVGGTVSAAVLANMVTAARAGALTNGLAQGEDLINLADAGANIQANEIMRTQLFGRPLTPSEACKSHQEFVSYLNEKESQKSAYNRYLSLRDADSLLTHTGMMLAGNLNRTLPNSMMTLSNYLLKPTTLLGSLANMFTGKALAATNCAQETSKYGNVQFGWTDAENTKISTDPSYGVLDNQEILDQSGKESEIADKYDKCFGYHYDGKGDDNTIYDPTDINTSLHLDTTDPSGDGQHGSLGDLLSQGHIVLDGSNGGVKDDPSSLCAPTNLGPNNPTYGDLVFRWRVAMAYYTTLDQLIGESHAKAEK